MSVEVNRDSEEIQVERTLRRGGNSIVVSIPPQLLQHAGLDIGDDVDVITPFVGESIEIKKSQPDDQAPDDE